MADNVTMPLTGSGDATALIAADEIAGVKHQRVKLTLGADGVNDGDISSSNPVPITAAALPLPAGAATSAKQDTAQTSLSSIDTKTPALGQALAAASVPVVLTAAQLSTLTPVAGGATLAEQQTQTASLSVLDDWDETDRAKVNIVVGQAGITAGAGSVAANTPRVTHASDDPAVAVLGAVADAAVVTDTTGTLSGKLRGLVKWAFERMPASLGQKVMASSLAVTLASDQSAVPVSGPLTDAQLRATPVPVSGAITANPTGYIVRLDEASPTITYVGYAAPGTATSSAAWSIKRLDSASGLVVLWGAGTAAFNQIWDNRAGLAYS